MNLLMISGDSTIAAGRRGAFYLMLERFAPVWSRVDVIVPRPSAVVTTELFGNVFVHPSSKTKAWQWRHIADCGRALHRKRPYALMTSHDYGWHVNGLGAWLLNRMTGTPYVSEIHHVTGYPRSANLIERAQRCATQLYIRAVKRRVAGFRVVNAIELPNLLRRLGVPQGKILILNSLYIDTDVFTPRPVDKQFDVMFCGRADTNKGVGILLRAFARIVRTRPTASLLLRTAGPAEASWRRLADRLAITPHLTWRGWVRSESELAELYRASRMLVCTSFSEGGPRVTAEAMACGIPVISTPVGLMPELIEPGRSGLLVDWTPTSVAAAIERLLDDPEAAATIGAAGRERVARFERSAVIDAYASAYAALARGETLAPRRGDERG